MKHSAVPIKNITRDASGAIIGWSEHGFDFTVSHNADGLPIIVNGTDGINSVWAKLNYVDGKFVGVVGDSIDSAVMNEIFAVAIGRVVTTSRDPVTGGISLSAGGQSISIGGAADNPAYINFNRGNTRKLRKMLNNVLSGTSSGKLLLIGDSTTMGYGAAAATHVGARAVNFPTQLAKLFSAHGYACSNESIFGDQNVTSGQYNQYDPRVVQTNFGRAAVASAGGFPFASSTAGGTLVFTPTIEFDRIEIVYAKQTSGGSFTTNIDSDAPLGTVSTAAASALATQTYSVTKGLHSITLTNQSTAQSIVVGIRVYDSTMPRIDIIQAGNSGSSASLHSNKTYAFAPCLTYAYLAPDVALIELTINDAVAGTAPATYAGHIQTVITDLKAVGSDVVLVVGYASDTALSGSTLAGIVAALKDLSTTNDVPVIDMPAAIGDYAELNALGEMRDQRHPTALGYADGARLKFDALCRVVF